ncbi:unnamed protein product, partial [Callosobruchus maculatus]
VILLFPGVALGHLCGGSSGSGGSADKSKVHQRYSGHARITKARSNPQESNRIVYDEATIEHMVTYSPISTRSRCNLHQNSTTRRRDSMNSSIGATSVRRLLAVVRGGGGHGSQTGRTGSSVYSRRALLSNLLCLCLIHLISTSALEPFLALQSSVSVWWEGPVETDARAGALLVSAACLAAALTTLVATPLLRWAGSGAVIVAGNGAMVLFYLSHFYSMIYITIPAYILLGIVQGLLSCSHISFLMILAHRITALFHEEDEEARQMKKICIIRRVARAFRGAHDFGLIIGSIYSAILITSTIHLRTGGYIYDNITYVSDDCLASNATLSSGIAPSLACANATYSAPPEYNTQLDLLFDRDEEGRICGAQACPVFGSVVNGTLLVDGEEEEEVGEAQFSGVFKVLPGKSPEYLTGIYAGCCLAAFLIGMIWLDGIRLADYQDDLGGIEALATVKAIKDHFRDSRLQMAAPLAIFIGIEQAFMYADFSKSYVMCTLGIHRLNYVFLAMGLLQSVAACTLSMLLRTIRRYYVVAVGFIFHGCLLMVLFLWKPIDDDPALFYVISASWGVCNAIWEMLMFSLLTNQYSDNWESAFAITSFFRFMGSSLSFLFHGFVCNSLKLYTLGMFLLVAVVSFGWLEVKLENNKKIKNISRL